MKKTLLCLLFLLFLTSTPALADGVPSASIPVYVARAIADQSRPKDDVAADALRDPADTLAFAGVKPGMVVGELFPGGGYFTAMLSRILGPEGHDYALENAGWDDAVKADKAMLANGAYANVSLDVEPFGQFKLPQKIDLFWITQNYHDLHIAKYGPDKKAIDMAAFNRRVFDALKPGGVYFILDHQANPGTTEAQIAVLHRIETTQVIKEVTAAGFKLVAGGNFLHRADDDHTKTIFDPAIRGKTDQFALKFVKP